MKTNFLLFIFTISVLLITNCTVSKNIDTNDNFLIQKSNAGILFIDILTDKERAVLKDSIVVRENVTPNLITNREIIHRNWKALYKDQHFKKFDGTTSLKFCLNRSGEVKYSEILPNETTTTDENQLKRVLKAFMGYKYSEDITAPIIQCGKYELKIEMN